MDERGPVEEGQLALELTEPEVEKGIGDEAVSSTVNVPLEAGARDQAFIDAYERVIVPALDRFEPEVLLVSAGFDAHHLDPLGGLRVTTDGIRVVAGLIDDAARRLCGRRTAWVTEGGYHLEALRDCLDVTIDVLS